MTCGSGHLHARAVANLGLAGSSIVEEMEKQGVVSSPDHTNKREVLVAAA